MSSDESDGDGDWGQAIIQKIGTIVGSKVKAIKDSVEDIGKKVEELGTRMDKMDQQIILLQQQAAAADSSQPGMAAESAFRAGLIQVMLLNGTLAQQVTPNPNPQLVQGGGPPRTPVLSIAPDAMGISVSQETAQSVSLVPDECQSQCEVETSNSNPFRLEKRKEADDQQSTPKRRKAIKLTPATATSQIITELETMPMEWRQRLQPLIDPDKSGHDKLNSIQRAYMKYEASQLVSGKGSLTPEKITEIIEKGRENLIFGVDSPSEEVSFSKYVENRLKNEKRKLRQQRKLVRMEEEIKRVISNEEEV